MTKKSPHVPSAKPWRLNQFAPNRVVIGGGTGMTESVALFQDDREAARAVAAVNACSPIQGDPAEALAKAREALDHFANFIGHPNPDKRERKDCELRAMAAATLAALGSPL